MLYISFIIQQKGRYAWLFCKTSCHYLHNTPRLKPSPKQRVMHPQRRKCTWNSLQFLSSKSVNGVKCITATSLQAKKKAKCSASSECRRRRRRRQCTSVERALCGIHTPFRQRNPARPAGCVTWRVHDPPARGRRGGKLKIQISSLLLRRHFHNHYAPMDDKPENKVE